MMVDNDFPVRLAGQRFGLTARDIRGVTPTEVTSRLRYQQTFPRT
jgi:hypothetical protein